MASSSSSRVYEGPPHYGMKLPDEIYLAPPNEKTFQHQDTLPSLPVRDLQDTLDRYLETLRPHLNDEEMKRSVAIAKDFANGIGKTLHQKLVEKAMDNRNWLIDWWEDYGYLYRREPHAPDINILGPAAYHMFLWPPKEGTQCERAALSTWFTLKYWEMLKKETVRVDRSSTKEPQCMVQPRQQLNGCKTPGLVKDKLNYYFKTDSEGGAPGHICVLCRGRIFTFDCLDENGYVLTAPEIQLQYERVRQQCDRLAEAGPSVGALTADNRVTWYKAREHILELHPDNAKHLHTIQSSVLMMALEDKSVSYSEISWEAMAGDGVNRWFDKGFTLVTFKNGMIGSNCDHTPAEGMVMVQVSYFTLLCLQMCNGQWTGTPVVRPLPQPTELDFHLDSQILTSISNAKQTFQKNGANIDVANHFCKAYGKSFIRKHKLHPDAFVQVALQCAYYGMYRKPAATYETATIRKYFRGRTETVRSCTMEALNFSRAMVDPAVPKSKRLELMHTAIQKHISVAKDCSEFKGCDRHLMGLQILASEAGLPVPELFKDPAYVKSGGGGNYILSTSFVGYTPVFGGTAPMCKDGYGTFYSIPNDRISFFLVSWKADKATNAKRLGVALEQTLLDMKDLLESQPGSARL